MSIILHLEADTVEQLREKAVAALGIDGLKLPRPFAPVSEAQEVAAKRPVGRPRKVQPDPVPDPDQEPIDNTALEDAHFGVDIDNGPATNEIPFNGSAPTDAIALEKLKQETVAKLPDMFAAGKVNLMRAVLTKYGKGAKSFPEIEAKDFPEIAAALQRGDGS